jgi:regulator of RNase E activity RraA
MLGYAEKIGMAGAVIYGSIRDSGEIRKGSFPVFACGVSHRGPYKDGPGEINVPIALDGMVIEPGDLIIGDDDGLLCVPFDQVEEVYAAASAKHRAEEETIAETRAGTVDRTWVEDALKRLKVEGA